MPMTKKKQSNNGGADRLARILLGVACTALIAVVILTATGISRHRQSPRRTDIAAAYSIHGIDVSHHQGSINWDKVCRATLHHQPIRFVFAKCSEGTTRLDRQYKRNQQEIRQRNLYFGAYHFFVPGRSPQEQARLFISNANLQKGDLIPVLDVEKAGKLSNRQLVEDVLQWLETVGRHYNCVPALYTGHAFLHKHLNDERISRYPLWKAHYQDKGIITGQDWTFCQYTRHGHVAGIGDGKKDYVDLNVFRGTPEDLASLTLAD